MRHLEKQIPNDLRFASVETRIINPKSISMGELYGEENIDTKEWTDGLASKIIRKFAKKEKIEKDRHGLEIRK
jgi:dynein heavy chain